MAQQVTKVRVFVASPGDVQRERDSLSVVIEELNITLGQNLGFVAELVRWETHCRPAMGRPQGVINEQIGEYDIFIGIMWKRFGSPTGEAESGTEEEFNLAYERWRQDERLHIFFYFCKAATTLNTKEELEQAGKVLDFKNELKDRGLVWEYPEAAAFADTVRRHIYPLLLEMFLPKRTSEGPSETADRPTPPAEVPDAQVEQAAEAAFEDHTSVELHPGPRQMTESVNALEAALRREDFVSGARFSGDLDEFQLLRLQLLTSTWLAERIPSSMLGVHEANLLYLNRELLRLTGPEFTSLLRMLIDDHFGRIPGWYWFKRFEAEAVEGVILHLAFSDPHQTVRYRAFELLSSARVPLPDDVRERMSWTVTSDSSPEVRRAALSYIGNSGGQAYLPVIGSALVDGESAVSYQAKVSMYLLLARIEPDRALGELLDEANVEVKSIVNELLPGAGEIRSETLLRALDHAKDEVRFFAIKELIRRGELTVELAILRKEDKYDPVRAAAYRFLIERGVEIGDEDIAWKIPSDQLSRLVGRKSFIRLRRPVWREQILLEFYRRYDVSQLVRMAAWDRLAGHEAYRALAVEHFHEFGERLREDLRTEFAAESHEYYRKQLEEWRRMETVPFTSGNVGLLMSSSLSLLAGRKREPAEQEPMTAEKMAESDVTGRRIYYIAAALAGLWRNGAPEDVELGRRLLSHEDNDVRIEATRIIHRWGNADDVPTLIKVAKSSDGLLQELAAKAALTLAADPREVAAEFFETGDELLVSVSVVEFIARKDKDNSEDFLIRYLYGEDERVRTRVLAFFALRYTDQELEDLLAQYTSEAVYYYDVVCFFDRLLYAPPHLRSFYLESVKGGFLGLLNEEHD